MKIRKCPCGGKPKIYSEDENPPYMVVCEYCLSGLLQFAKKSEAIKNWNNLMKVKL